MADPSLQHSSNAVHTFICSAILECGGFPYNTSNNTECPNYYETETLH